MLERTTNVTVTDDLEITHYQNRLSLFMERALSHEVNATEIITAYDDTIHLMGLGVNVELNSILHIAKDYGVTIAPDNKTLQKILEEYTK